MHPFTKPIHELELADIQVLIDNGIPEGRTLDYKRDLYGGGDAEKKEFLCDISAFANTVGGHLIIGVDEEDRIPKAITPVEIKDVDTEQQRFENLFRTAVDPPIRGVEFQAIGAGGGKYILVIEIPRSLSRPHAVNHKGHWRFYGRNSIGKYPYEVDDVRKAILQSETLAVRIRNFRNDRLAQISVGDTPIPVYDGAKIILHVIPVSSLEIGSQHDIDRMLAVGVLPIHPQGGYSHRVNLDGLLTFQPDSKTRYALGYAQLFRNGIIEAVDAFSLTCGEENRIPSKSFEIDMVVALEAYRTTLVRLDVGFPFWVCVSLLGVKRYQMGTGTPPLRGPEYIDRDQVILTEIQVEDGETPGQTLLKPAFDAVWNACGYERSMNYGEDGNWLLKGQ